MFTANDKTILDLSRQVQDLQGALEREQGTIQRLQAEYERANGTLGESQTTLTNISMERARMQGTIKHLESEVAAKMEVGVCLLFTRVRVLRFAYQLCCDESPVR